MEKTQKLMSIAIAVLALEGCRGASTEQAAAPRPSGSPTPSAVGSTHHYYGHSHVGSFAAGAAVGAALGGNRRYPPRGGYPQSGYGNAATVDRTLGGNRNTGFFGRFFGRGGGFGGFGARGFGG